jgi:AcrR family transcriptional regulator
MSIRAEGPKSVGPCVSLHPLWESPRPESTDSGEDMESVSGALGPSLSGRKRMRSTVQPTTPQGEATYQRLLAAAVGEFLAHGYVGARVEEITRAAGVAYGTFYRYFHAKSDVIRALADAVYRNIFTEATRETYSQGPLAERVFADILLSLKAFTRHRDAVRVLDDAVGADPSVAAEVQRLQQRDVDEYVEILSTAPDYHPIAEPHLVSLLVNALGDEVARRWIHSDKCTGNPVRDEPELVRIAQVQMIMALSVVDPSSLGLSEARLRALYERMSPDV